MVEDRTLIWVHPSLKKKLKRESIDNDMNLLEFTKFLGNNPGSLLGKDVVEEKKEEIKRRPFRLDF